MEDKPQKNEKKVIRYHLVRHKWPDEIQAEQEKKKKKALSICICIICFLSGFLFDRVMIGDAASSNSQFSKLEQIYSIMANNWYFGKEVEDLDTTLMNNAIHGLVSNSLDKHTMYMEPEEYEDFATSLQGKFVGIGIQYYDMGDHTFVVDRVFKGSGAEAGGMMKGDIIISVDGEDVSDKSITEVSEMVKGEENSEVSIGVLRENQNLELTIKRQSVNSSVYGYEKETAGVLEISSFAETSGEETGKYLSDFEQKGIRNLIIDLRGNSGGYVNAAMQIASYLIPEGSVVYQEQNKAGKISEKYTYQNTPQYAFDEIILLIDNETASASEVLAICLKEQLDHVTLIGEKSYGKGTVQMPITFEDGSSLKYTIAEWLSPNGEHINGVGITPDIEVALDSALSTGMPEIKEGERYYADQVSIYAKPVQRYLRFLGYQADRDDEYFSIASSEALKQYQNDHGLQASGEIDEETIKSLMSSCALKWHQEQDVLDTQMNAALAQLQG